MKRGLHLVIVVTPHTGMKKDILIPVRTCVFQNKNVYEIVRCT